MELISMHDYCYVGLGVTERQQLEDVKTQHELRMQLKKLNLMIV